MTRPFFKIGAGHCVIKRFRSQRFKALIKGLPFLIKGRCTKSPDICHPQIISSGKNQAPARKWRQGLPFFTARKAPVIRRCTISLSPPLSMRDKYFPRRRTAVTTASLRPFLNPSGEGWTIMRGNKILTSSIFCSNTYGSREIRTCSTSGSSGIHFSFTLREKRRGSPHTFPLILRQPRSYRRQYQPQGAPSV